MKIKKKLLVLSSALLVGLAVVPFASCSNQNGEITTPPITEPKPGPTPPAPTPTPEPQPPVTAPDDSVNPDVPDGNLPSEPTEEVKVRDFGVKVSLFNEEGASLGESEQTLQMKLEKQNPFRFKIDGEVRSAYSSERKVYSFVGIVFDNNEEMIEKWDDCGIPYINIETKIGDYVFEGFDRSATASTSENFIDYIQYDLVLTKVFVKDDVMEVKLNYKKATNTIKIVTRDGLELASGEFRNSKHMVEAFYSGQNAHLTKPSFFTTQDLEKAGLITDEFKAFFNIEEQLIDHYKYSSEYNDYYSSFLSDDASEQELTLELSGKEEEYVRIEMKKILNPSDDTPGSIGYVDSVYKSDFDKLKDILVSCTKENVPSPYDYQYWKNITFKYFVNRSYVSFTLDELDSIKDALFANANNYIGIFYEASIRRLNIEYNQMVLDRDSSQILVNNSLGTKEYSKLNGSNGPLNFEEIVKNFNGYKEYQGMVFEGFYSDSDFNNKIDNGYELDWTKITEQNLSVYAKYTINSKLPIELDYEVVYSELYESNMAAVNDIVQVKFPLTSNGFVSDKKNQAKLVGDNDEEYIGRIEGGIIVNSKLVFDLPLYFFLDGNYKMTYYGYHNPLEEGTEYSEFDVEISLDRLSSDNAYANTIVLTKENYNYGYLMPKVENQNNEFSYKIRRDEFNYYVNGTNESLYVYNYNMLLLDDIKITSQDDFNKTIFGRNSSIVGNINLNDYAITLNIANANADVMLFGAIIGDLENGTLNLKGFKAIKEVSNTDGYYNYALTPAMSGSIKNVTVNANLGYEITSNKKTTNNFIIGYQQRGEFENFEINVDYKLTLTDIEYRKAMYSATNYFAPIAYLAGSTLDMNELLDNSDFDGNKDDLSVLVYYGNAYYNWHGEKANTQLQVKRKSDLIREIKGITINILGVKVDDNSSQKNMIDIIAEGDYYQNSSRDDVIKATNPLIFSSLTERTEISAFEFTTKVNKGTLAPTLNYFTFYANTSSYGGEDILGTYYKRHENGWTYMTDINSGIKINNDINVIIKEDAPYKNFDKAFDSFDYVTKAYFHLVYENVIRNGTMYPTSFGGWAHASAGALIDNKVDEMKNIGLTNMDRSYFLN